MVLPAMCITPMRWVTSALARMRPRGLVTTTQSRFLIPFSCASPCPGSMNSSGCTAAGALAAPPVEVLDPLLRREPVPELNEQLGLQLGEPRQPAAHRAREVVLRQPVRADHVRELRVAHHRELVVRLGR